MRYHIIAAPNQYDNKIPNAATILALKKEMLKTLRKLQIKEPGVNYSKLFYLHDKDSLRLLMALLLENDEIIIHGEGDPFSIGPYILTKQAPYILTAYQLALLLKKNQLPDFNITINLLTCNSATSYQEGERTYNFSFDLSQALSALGYRSISVAGYAGYVKVKNNAAFSVTSQAGVSQKRTHASLDNTKFIYKNDEILSKGKKLYNPEGEWLSPHIPRIQAEKAIITKLRSSATLMRNRARYIQAISGLSIDHFYPAEQLKLRWNADNVGLPMMHDYFFSELSKCTALKKIHFTLEYACSSMLLTILPRLMTILADVSTQIESFEFELKELEAIENYDLFFDTITSAISSLVAIAPQLNNLKKLKLDIRLNSDFPDGHGVILGREIIAFLRALPRKEKLKDLFLDLVNFEFFNDKYQHDGQLFPDTIRSYTELERVYFKNNYVNEKDQWLLGQFFSTHKMIKHLLLNFEGNQGSGEFLNCLLANKGLITLIVEACINGFDNEDGAQCPIGVLANHIKNNRSLRALSFLTTLEGYSFNDIKRSLINILQNTTLNALSLNFGGTTTNEESLNLILQTFYSNFNIYDCELNLVSKENQALNARFKEQMALIMARNKSIRELLRTMLTTSALMSFSINIKEKSVVQSQLNLITNSMTKVAAFLTMSDFKKLNCAYPAFFTPIPDMSVVKSNEIESKIQKMTC